MRAAKLFRPVVLAFPALLLAGGPSLAQTQQAAVPQTLGEKSYVVPAGTILRVSMVAPLKPSHLQAGSDIEGELSRPVYVYDRQVIPAGSHIRAVVAEVDKHKVQKKGFVEHLQTIRSLGLNRKFDYDVTFQSAFLTPPNGTATPIEVKFIEAGDVVELHTKGDQIQIGGTTAGDYAKMAPGVGKVESIKHGKKQVQQYRHPVVSLETEQPLSFTLPPDAAEPVAAPADVSTIPSGTHARLLLLEPLSASENKQGDIFHARVLEPIVQNGQLLLAEGSTLEGHVGKIVPPRRLNRAGSVFLVFDKLLLQNGASEKIAASLVSTELDPKAAGRMDEEGGLHGKGRGAKQTMKDFGVGLVSQQVIDEVVELATHAVAPYVSIPMGLAMFLGGHGRDVELPRYTELEIVFGRPMPIGTSAAAPAQSQPASQQTEPQRK
ncbi:MAG: hypothetical protein LAN37_04720 [Acidobacteriia bacterium]|nr:hypothetical protein [Terriglobia bacterium]